MRKEEILDFVRRKGTLGALTLCLVGAVAFVSYQASYPEETKQAEGTAAEDAGTAEELAENGSQATDSAKEAAAGVSGSETTDGDGNSAVEGTAADNGTAGANGTGTDSLTANAGATDGIGSGTGDAAEEGTGENGTGDVLADSTNGSGTVDVLADGTNGSGTVDVLADGTGENGTGDVQADSTDGGGTGDVLADGTDGSGTEAQAASAQAGAASEEISGTDSAGTASGEAAADTSDEEDTAVWSSGVLQPTVSFTEASSLTWPAAGTVLMDYNMNGTVYFQTLNEYKYNPAMIISSETGSPVLASSKGIVESITQDEETGTTLTLNIGDDYQLIYGQLTDLTVEEGDVVEQGALLGYVGEPTKYYCEEGSNLYFAMKKDGESVDPGLYLEG